MSTTRMTQEEFQALTGKKPKAKKSKPDGPSLCDMYAVTAKTATIKLPWPVSVNKYYIRTRFGGVAIGSKGKAYRKIVAREWREQVGTVTFQGRLAVRLECVFPDNIERDLDNIEKCLFDALQHAGAYRRDSQIKLKTSEQHLVQPPGWVTVTIGMKPGIAVQTGLFGNEW